MLRQLFGQLWFLSTPGKLDSSKWLKRKYLIYRSYCGLIWRLISRLLLFFFFLTKNNSWCKFNTWVDIAEDGLIKSVIKLSSPQHIFEICPGFNAKEIQIHHDKHHKKSPKHEQFCQIWSHMKMSNNPAKDEVLIKQYLRSILDISEGFKLYNMLDRVWSIN